MTEANETRVFYKALADFSKFKKELRDVDKALATTAAAEKAFNTQSAKDRAAATKAATARATALKNENAALKLVLARQLLYKNRQKAITTEVRLATTQIKNQNRALLTNTERLIAATAAAREYAKAQKDITKSTGLSSDAIRAQKEFAKAQKTAAGATREKTQALKEDAVATNESHKANVRFVKGVGDVDRKTGEVVRTIENGAKRAAVWKRILDGATGAMVRFGGSGDKLPPILARIESGGNRAYRSLEKFGNWRPRLIPPFVALVPIIGAVIAALNPLVALLGAVGGAAIGLAGQIGSLAGAFVALPGILSGVVAGIAGVIASMGGVGSVFKTYSAMQKALGKGGTGTNQADRADQLAAAESNLAKAQRNVTKAQENLNRAREEALKDLQALRREVERASLNEDRAIADLQQARDDYNNIMADPGSQLGDKMDAAVRVREAEQDLADVRRQNVENQEALTEAERKGVDQSQKVLDAQEALVDATEAQKDAQKGLNVEMQGGSEAASAIDEYNAALAALSPSAQKVVLALIAMQDQWKAMRADLQETFFSQFVDDMDTLPQIIQNISNFLKPATASMGRFVSKFLNLFASPAWTRDLATIGETNGKVIANLADGFLGLATFIKDVMVAAGPFTEWMTNGFARGAENMALLLDTDEERGRFAGWLEKVETRLRNWWDIVKNIGMTIFNFSSAASGFGDWFAEGFLEMTENWRKASEEAMEPGSGFKKWLEDIKEPLRIVDELLGKFFAWFGREAAEEGNIKSLSRILTIIKDDLGPALGRLLDTLAETDIDEKFLMALTSIVESIDTIMENGGSAAFESFFNIVTGAFEAIAWAFSIIPEPILTGFLALFGLLAGITFVGKFTGLTALLGKMLAFTPLTFSSFTTLFTAVAGLSPLKFLGLLGVLGAMITLAGLAAKGYMDWTAEINDPDKSGITDSDAQYIAGQAMGGANGQSGIVPLPNQEESILNGNVFGEGDRAEFQKNWSNFWRDIGITLSGALNGLDTELGNYYRDLGQDWMDFWNGVGTFFGDWWDGWTTELGNYWRDLSGDWTDLWNGMQDALNIAVAGLGIIWAGIQTQFAAPINWVITNVWNNGIAAFWNDIASKLGMGTLPILPLVAAAPAAPAASNARRVGGGGFGSRAVAEGGVLDFGSRSYKNAGVLPGYTPGTDVHTFFSSTGGKLKLSGGEAIMRPEFTKMMGGEEGIKQLNKAAVSKRFASGGVFGNSNDGARRVGTGGPFEDLLGQLDPLKWIKDTLYNIVNPLMGGFSNNAWGQGISRIPGKMIDGMINKVKESLVANPIGGGGPANAMGWQNQWALIKQAFPWANLNDAYRPGDPNYHGKGRAVDLTASMEIFNWIRSNFPNSRELIYSPANERQLLNGANYSWPSQRAYHWDHVHWAMNKGGVIPEGTHDQGGWIGPGGFAHNNTNKPEAVLTNDESLGLKRLLAGAGIGQGSAPTLGSAVTGFGKEAPAMVIDNSVNIGQLTVQNPVPERVSTSLPKQIRKLGNPKEARST